MSRGHNLGLSRGLAAAAALAAGLGADPARANDEARPPGALDEELLASVQGLLAVQRLDGWLLCDAGGENPVALDLVRPDGAPADRWFYFIPATGEPIALTRPGDRDRVAAAPGDVRTYEGRADLDGALSDALGGAERIAMEHDPDGAHPELDRVDGDTADRVTEIGVDIESSSHLVLRTVARWLEAGRVAHYAAVHHLLAARDDALRFAGRRLAAGERVTERAIQARAARSLAIRGVAGPPPRVAAGENAADPSYVPDERRSAELSPGDLVIFDFAGRVEAADRPVYADMAWTFYAGREVPERYRELFSAAAGARDAAIEKLRSRRSAGEDPRGYAIDRIAREVVETRGYADAWRHRTGASLGTVRPGLGAHLQGGPAADTRPLAPGTGATIGPGLYEAGDGGVKTQVGAYVAADGVEITGPLQERIAPLIE